MEEEFEGISEVEIEEESEDESEISDLPSYKSDDELVKHSGRLIKKSQLSTEARRSLKRVKSIL